MKHKGCGAQQNAVEGLAGITAPVQTQQSSTHYVAGQGCGVVVQIGECQVLGCSQGCEVALQGVGTKVAAEWQLAQSMPRHRTASQSQPAQNSWTWHEARQLRTAVQPGSTHRQYNPLTCDVRDVHAQLLYVGGRVCRLRDATDCQAQEGKHLANPAKANQDQKMELLVPQYYQQAMQCLRSGGC